MAETNTIVQSNSLPIFKCNKKNIQKKLENFSELYKKVCLNTWNSCISGKTNQEVHFLKKLELQK